MSDDICSELRQWDKCCAQWGCDGEQTGSCSECDVRWQAADEIERCNQEIGRLRSLIIEWADAEEAANAVFSGPETVAVDNRLSIAIDNLHDEARRG